MYTVYKVVDNQVVNIATFQDAFSAWDLAEAVRLETGELTLVRLEW